jgi:hypothetical protein
MVNIFPTIYRDVSDAKFLIKLPNCPYCSYLYWLLPFSFNYLVKYIQWDIIKPFDVCINFKVSLYIVFVRLLNAYMYYVGSYKSWSDMSPNASTIVSRTIVLETIARSISSCIFNIYCFVPRAQKGLSAKALWLCLTCR